MTDVVDTYYVKDSVYLQTCFDNRTQQLFVGLMLREIDRETNYYLELWRSGSPSPKKDIKDMGRPCAFLCASGHILMLLRSRLTSSSGFGSQRINTDQPF